MTEPSETPAAPLVVVFDTNVLVPLLLPASQSSRLYSRLLRIGAHVAITPQIATELEDKLRTKTSLRKWLGISDADIDQFVNALPSLCRFISGILTAPGSVSADPDDEAVMAAALESQASYIITEDRHLLDLRSYQGVRILTRKEMESELDRLGFTR